MVTSPHHLASEAGLRVLREGGNAIEATVAMAASLAVVYPHMTSIGGDGFWLIAPAGFDPIGIDGCGGAAATPDFYHARGLDAVPTRGPLAANTVAGTVGGWGEALRLSGDLGGRMPLSRLVEDAVWSGEHGFAVTASQSELTAEKFRELKDQPNFAKSFLPDGKAPAEGAIMRLPALAETLRRLGRDGASSFYEGRLARDIAADLADCGSPVALADLTAFRAERRKPLHVRVSQADLYNFPPPTQGLASLMILALFDRLGVSEGEGFAHVHGLVEATKLAFLTRDAVVGCPSAMRENAEAFLTDMALDALAEKIDSEHALAWPRPSEPGDTVWLGAIDGNGLAVSFIQSIFFEYGSGCVLGNTGIVWQNRGASFVLSGDGPRLLARGRKPFHTLNPAMAFFDDGRRMVYGTMGGEGQPQTQAAVFSRYAFFGQGLQAAATAPRWLLGKTWGENSITLKLENRFPPELIAALQKAGHDIEILPEFTSTMGHAGAIVRRPEGVFEGAADPRSDGAAMGF
jgi:gamma-glutamyltranspeptidase/glutathione hydrolase